MCCVCTLLGGGVVGGEGFRMQEKGVAYWPEGGWSRVHRPLPPLLHRLLSTPRPSTQTDCLLYEWSIDDLEVFASRLSPSVPAFWRSFVLCEVGLEYAGRVHPARGTRSANGEWEGPEYEAGARSRDFTEPLRPEELPPRRGLWGTLRAVLRVFDPLPPAGLRHCSTPMSGVMARNRLAAVAAAKGLEQRATLQEEERAQDDVEAAKAVAGVK